jgi:putative peptidoglycan lipid II flippase
MIRNLLSVGAYTLLSRVTGFARDIVLGAVLGAGLANDAFVVAFRLPNHFRAIFGEGAFNAAYVPAYSRVLQQDGVRQATEFASRIFTLLLASQIVLLVLGLAFTPTLVDLLAPGFRSDPQKFDLAVALTRITFPYLLFITLVTLHTGTLNANGRFTAGAFAPVLLNVAMIAALACVAFFPDAAHAAAAGVLAAGVLQLALVIVAARRAHILERLAWPRLDANVRRFFNALGPAVIGSAGIQIALFADTIIGSLLPTGGVSSIYYADRLYQLPIGVIGIAAGTVLLPEMSRAFASGDRAGAFRAQNRTLALSIALATPCFVAFLAMPDLLMRAAFVRGRFTLADANAAADVLNAYGLGLLPVVLIASARASFQARGNTTTPMMVALAAVAVNVGLKLLLFRPLGAPGLALGTAAGAWVNLLALGAIAIRGRVMRLDSVLNKTTFATIAASVALAVTILLMRAPALALGAKTGMFDYVVAVALIGLAGAVVYVLVFLVGVRMLGLDLRRLRPIRRRNFLPDAR